jgi:hypothetical protein
MSTFRYIRNYILPIIYVFATVSIGTFSLLSSNASANSCMNSEDPKWTIYFRPGVRFGTDDRTLYVMDFLVPLYQGDKGILFANPKYTPNDRDGWEVNLGLGYRQI